MEFTNEPLISGSTCGRYKHQVRWRFDKDESLPILGFVAARPEMGHWLSCNELNWATSLARELCYGAISMAFVTPECSQYGFRSEEKGAPQAERELAAKGILAMIDESASVVCAWGAHRGGPEVMQFIQMERPHTWLFHMGLTNGNPKRLGNAALGTLLTRWRV